MSDKSTSNMISAYLEEASAPMFLSGFFKTPPENVHTTEKVEIDIMRDGNDVAIALQDYTANARENEASLYQNKAFTPPIFDEAGAINAYDAINRLPGQNPFTNPVYGANAFKQAVTIWRRLENKVRRAIELMASQVLQTGVITAVDTAGNTLYTLDFGMKSGHKVTTTTWAADGSTGAPMSDISSLGTVVRRDGQKVPDRLLFGLGAWQRFLANAKVQLALGRIATLGLGELAPQMRGEGATFQGYIFVDGYRYEMWTYDGFYKNPNGGAQTPYIADNNVIMMASSGRLDLSYGAIPIIVPPESRVLPFLPPRITSGEKGLDLTTNVWVTDNGKHLKVSGGTRPLTIPTAIDTYGRLTVF
jgi:hypothetical protein